MMQRKTVRHMLMGLALALVSTSGLQTASADDRIIFRNQSPVPVRVRVFSDDGRYRGSETFSPWESSRLTNGKGKTRVSINGRTFRVSDIGYRSDGRWIITWRDRSKASFRPPVVRTKPSFPPHYRARY